jgi:cytochrome c peroxidase
MDVLKRDHHALVGWNVDACNTSHSPNLHFGDASTTAERRKIRLGVRWRPALAEKPKRTQKSHALENGAGTQNDFRIGGI